MLILALSSIPSSPLRMYSNVGRKLNELKVIIYFRGAQLRLCTSSLATSKDVLLENLILGLLNENAFDTAHVSQSKTFYGYGYHGSVDVNGSLHSSEDNFKHMHSIGCKFLKFI